MGPRDQPPIHPKAAKAGRDPSLPLGEERRPAGELGLEVAGPGEPGLERRPVRGDVVAVQRVAHLEAQRVPRSETARLEADRAARFEQPAPERRSRIFGGEQLVPPLPRVARAGDEDLRALVGADRAAHEAQVRCLADEAAHDLR